MDAKNEIIIFVQFIVSFISRGLANDIFSYIRSSGRSRGLRYCGFPISPDKVKCVFLLNHKYCVSQSRLDANNEMIILVQFIVSFISRVPALPSHSFISHSLRIWPEAVVMRPRNHCGCSESQKEHLYWLKLAIEEIQILG